MIAFSEFDATLRPALLAASSRHFGAASYQADARYLHWLYRRNPASSGFSDCIVAVQEGIVVGCMHRLMLPMTGGRRLGALHNHFVDPAIRSGLGVLLLRRSTRDTDIAVAPGVEEKLAPIYQRLRFHETEGSWLQKPLSHLRIVAGLMRAKFGGGSRLLIPEPQAADDVAVTTRPTDQQLAELCDEMRRHEQENGIDWSEDLVRWRYFDPQGPKHMLIRSRSSAAFAVLALGRRKGVRTMRLMNVASSGQSGWMAVIERVARHTGAALGLAFTTDMCVREQLQAAGWMRRSARTSTFSTSATLTCLSPAATDLGFEAFCTEFA